MSNDGTLLDDDIRDAISLSLRRLLKETEGINS
jgi:hypothetical protein